MNIADILMKDQIRTKNLINKLFAEYGTIGYNAMIKKYPKHKVIFDDWLIRKL